MRPQYRDLRGATLKLKCGRLLTLPMGFYRNSEYGSVVYGYENGTVEDPHDIQRVLKFPNRKLPHGRDLRGCAVWLRNGDKMYIDSDWSRLVAYHRYVHYQSISGSHNAFDDDNKDSTHTHDIIRYRRK